MPYLIGPNKAPIRPNKNKATNSNGSEFSSKPATAMAAAPISTSFSRRATKALSKRSASSPPDAASRKNGAMKMPPASVTSASPVAPPILNRITKTSAFFRKLSLKVEKNWHQNSGAKRRDARSDCEIDLSRDRWRAANCGSRLSFHDVHKQALGVSVLDALDQLAGLVVVADRLGQRNAGLNQHHDAH